MLESTDPDTPSVDYVVGIGASAGGLEALEQLFENTPSDTGLTFVIVQHLSPKFESVMDELLLRKTEMDVRIVEDGVEIQPNSIYLIPPNKEMIISGGKLLLTDKDRQEGLSLPIDQFLLSLAREYGEQAIGVILSGTGSDGSRGIREIHDAGGLTIVQSEDSAKFDGMPKSAIETGIVDLILGPDDIGSALARYVNNPIRSELVAQTNPVDINDSSLNQLLRLLRDAHGIDFSVYKQSTILRRIERRLLLDRSVNLEEYVDSVKKNRENLNTLYKDLLITVTQFFRDPEAFDLLAEEMLPEQLSDLPDDEEFRVWVAGCATGEEAYSIAILLDELASPDVKPRIKIFATDVNQDSLDFASAGLYDNSSLANLSETRKERYFIRKSDRFQVCPDLRKMIVFAKQDLISDAPFTQLDLITCRNVLIYFQPLIQRKVVSLFNFGLKTDGVLFLGPSEGVGELEKEFKTKDRHWKIFAKRRNVRLNPEYKFYHSGNGVPLRRSATPPGVPTGGRNDIAHVYDELLNQHLSGSVLIDNHRQVLHVFGDAGQFLNIQKGRLTGDVLELFGDSFRTAVSGAIQRVASQGARTTYAGKLKRSDGTEGHVRVTVSPISDRTGGLTYMLLSFSEEEDLNNSASIVAGVASDASELDVTTYSQTYIAKLEDDLRYSRENLQATIEELETSNEELQATNEELVASNEELQSSNEELHSVNEELYTVNAEHQRKITELTELTDDMENLFSITDVGVLFLDTELSIRRYTPSIGRLFNFIDRDIGQSFDRFTHKICHDDLLDTIRSVLETQQSYECDVQDFSGHDYFLRICPHRSQDAVAGVVLTLIDVASQRLAERQARKNDTQLRGVIQNSPSFIFIKDIEGTYLAANDQCSSVFGIQPSELIGRTIHDVVPAVVADRVATSDRQVVATNAKVEIEETIPCHGKNHTYLTVKFPLRDEDEKIYAIAGIKVDITRLKLAQEKAERAVRERDRFLAMLSEELSSPLAAIQNASGALEKIPDADGRMTRVSDVIDRQGTHLARIVNDLRDISKVMQNEIELHKETFDFRQAAEDAFRDVDLMSKAKKIRIVKSIEDEPIAVFGDRSRLKQLITNLLINAIKYTSHEGTVWLYVRSNNGMASVEVTDTGRGMSKNLSRRVFDPFFQGDQASDYARSGMGVGLALVKSIAELHDGEVAASSEGEGQGSTFRCTLPLAAESMKAAVDPPKYSVAKPTMLKVVVVADEADVRDKVSVALESDGHQVIAVDDGLSGLTAIDVEKPEVAFIDIDSLQLDGCELMSRLKLKGGDQRTLCVAVMGFQRPEDVTRATDAGFHRHIAKPFRNEDLESVIAYATDFRKQLGN